MGDDVRLDAGTGRQPHVQSGKARSGSHGAAHDEQIAGRVTSPVWCWKRALKVADTIDRLRGQSHRWRVLVVGDGPEARLVPAAFPDAVFTIAGSRRWHRAYASLDIFFNRAPPRRSTLTDIGGHGVNADVRKATGSMSLVDHGSGTACWHQHGAGILFLTRLRLISYHRALGDASRKQSRRWDRILQACW